MANKYVGGKYGLEIGGSSPLFSPLYPLMAGCDGLNFSSTTVWGDFGTDFMASGKVMGKQFIGEATDLSMLKKTYDFILSCNNIEHIANPMKAIEQWIEHLKPGGVIIIIAPRKESNFDHRRPVTPFTHLHQDYVNEIDETDLTHLDEILRLHDLPLDPPAGNLEQFKARSLKNIENRCLHHHVFDTGNLTEMLEFFGLIIVESSLTVSDYIMIAER